MSYLHPNLPTGKDKPAALKYLLDSFNAEYHADIRAEKHTHVNRLCLMNTIEGMIVELERKKAVLEEEDNFSENTEYHDVAKRLTRLKTDRGVLRADGEDHFPHYALVVLTVAAIEGLDFVEHEEFPGFNFPIIFSDDIGLIGLAKVLRNKLQADSRVEDRYLALNNMVENLKSDENRTHDSFDRLVPVGHEALHTLIANPDALYAVLIQPPPQTGSAAIRGEQPAPGGGGT